MPVLNISFIHLFKNY